MARVKRGVAAHKRHKRLLKSAEGKRGTHSKLIKSAREAQLHAMAANWRSRDRPLASTAIPQSEITTTAAARLVANSICVKYHV